MEVLVMVGQLLLALSILVVVHEWGHMYAAKTFGMRVEKFYLFFDWKFSLFKFKKGETEYGIGWLPLGGYVKISGMIDESMDTEQMKEPAKDYEFRSKPAWQRLIVMLGGIIVNVVVGILIFIGLTYFVGEEYTTIEEVNKLGVTTYSEAGKLLGIESGDRIVNLNGKKIERFRDISSPDFFLSEGQYLTVLRDGSEKKLFVTSEFIDVQTSNKNNPFIAYRINAIIDTVVSKTAIKAGLKKGDKIVDVNGKPIIFRDELEAIVKSNKSKDVAIKVIRDGESKEVIAAVDKDGLLGIGFSPLPTEKETFSFGASISHGTKKAFTTLFSQVSALGKVFSGKLNPTKTLSGPIGMAKIFGGKWNWIRFWTICGILSMVLAFMNLLPIPALDGGHVMFLLYEMVAGKAPSEKVLIIAQNIGVVILMGLMVFIFGNDIYQLIFN